MFKVKIKNKTFPLTSMVLGNRSNGEIFGILRLGYQGKNQLYHPFGKKNDIPVKAHLFTMPPSHHAPLSSISLHYFPHTV
jgi:hypothetical protein